MVSYYTVLSPLVRQVIFIYIYTRNKKKIRNLLQFKVEDRKEKAEVSFWLMDSLCQSSLQSLPICMWMEKGQRMGFEHKQFYGNYIKSICRQIATKTFTL